MSTTYYALRDPFTALTVTATTLTASGGGITVTATFPDGDGPILAGLFRGEQLAHRSGGRLDVSRYIADDVVVVSEYGEVFTVGELRRGEG